MCIYVVAYQQEPHCPWSFTGVTPPFATQSTSAGRLLKSTGAL